MTQNNGNYSQVPGEVISAIYEMSKGANMLLVEKLNRPRFRKLFLSKDPDTQGITCVPSEICPRKFPMYPRCCFKEVVEDSMQQCCWGTVVPGCQQSGVTIPNIIVNNQEQYCANNIVWLDVFYYDIFRKERKKFYILSSNISISFEDLAYLQWQAPKKSREKSSVLVSQMTQVLEGKKTNFFENIRIPDDYKVLSISIMYTSDDGEQSLNFISEDKKKYDTWLIGLRALLNGIEDKEFIQELITGDEDPDRSVKAIVSTLERNSSKKEPDNRTGTGTVGTSTSLARQNTESCDLYTWGDGTKSKLGHGEETEEQKPRVVDALSRLNIRLVACGAKYMLCVTDCGETLSWGAGSKGQLGQGHLRDRYTPLRVEALQQQNVVHISCNEYHSAAVTDEGKLYTWGYGSIKLGYETGNEKQLTPKIVQSLSSHTVVQASCGKDFTLACTSDGQLFAFGNNKFYQLGLGDDAPRRDPTLVHFENIEDEHVVQVDCGDYHTAAVSDGGNVWMWGTNEFGQLGTEVNFAIISKPCKLQLSEDDSFIALIKDVSCGSRHTALVTFSGSVYCFGDNTNNQLGKKNTVDGPAKCNRPERIKFPSGVKMKTVSCGADYTAAVSEKGEIFTWGNGSNGKLGHGDDDSRFQPTQISECFDGKRVISVSCGITHTACTAAIRSTGSFVKKCMGCKKKFSIIQARCHCHRCNGTFCSSCAPKRPHRLCDKCFKIVQEEEV